MKILLYFEGENLIKVSGIGRAFEHQKRALASQGIEYTTDPWDNDYDILHINTYGANSESIIRHARGEGKKVIYHAHSTEEDFRDSFFLSNQIAPLYRTWLINLYNKADAIITPTPYSKSLLENYGITLPIYPVSNGIDPERYKKDQEKIKAFRKYFSLRSSWGLGFCSSEKDSLISWKLQRNFPIINSSGLVIFPNLSFPMKLPRRYKITPIM